MSLQADLELIRGAAVEAGKLALQARADGLKIWSKPGGSPVTDADIAVDILLKLRLLAARPNYGWLSEETVDDPVRLSLPRLFVVDPIDGTAAYLKGKPWFTVCIAVVQAGQPTCAVVYAPELDEMYEATVGGGAFLNGQPIRPSNATELEAANILGDARMFADPRWPQPWPPMRIEARNSIAYRVVQVACVGDHRGLGFTYNRPAPMQRSLLCAAPSLQQLILQRVSHIDPPA